jgi:hypothetical protein
VPAPPSVSAFLLADQVFQQASGKWCAIGIFSRIYAPQFPCLHFSLGLLVVLADAEGEYRVKVQFCDSHEREIAKFEGIKLVVKNRHDSVEFGIQTNQLPIATPGRYFFRLFFNDEMVKDKAVDVIQRGAANA